MRRPQPSAPTRRRAAAARTTAPRRRRAGRASASADRTLLFDWLPTRRFGLASASERARLFLPGRSLRLQLAGAGVAVIFALSAQSFASAREGAATYLIQPGETLSGIAAATGLPIERLV